MARLDDKDRAVLKRVLENTQTSERLPLFPVFSEFMDAALSYINGVDRGALEGLKCLAVEMHALTNQLLAMAPSAPSEDPIKWASQYSAEELREKCLQAAIANELARAFVEIAKAAQMQIDTLERVRAGGENAAIN